MLPFLVPVESHITARAVVRPVHPVEEAGARWGRSSSFSIEDPADEADPWADGNSPDDEEKQRGGVTIVWPQEHIYTSRTIDMTPVWRRYDLARVTAPDDPEAVIEVAVTRAMLFPLRTETLRYVGGGSYVIETEGRPYEERVLHSFLLLELPRLEGEWEIIQTGLTEGEWPTHPVELFSPGGFT